jgi:hypothetical protein
MKRILLALAIVSMILPGARQVRADSEVSVDFFYNNLNDGNWVEVGDYGYCWQPNVAVSNSDWRPYADGYWAYTDVGWTWVSNEDFGWATYHYGRWAHLEDQGWVWVPGYEWGPAWVSWRTGGDYVGWAPLPPTRERVYEGRAITGHVDVEFDIGPAYYNFVDVRYIGEPLLRERIVPTTQNVTVINDTVNVTNITYNNSVVYNYGPDYNRVSQYSVRPIQRLTLQRETSANLTAGFSSQSATKVEGQKLVIAAPQTIQKSAKATAPKNVKPKLVQPKIEHGWSGVSDPKVKTQLVQKMKAEDSKNVPPPKIAPSQNAGAAASPATAASTATGTPPAITGATATPSGRTTTATPAKPTPAGTAAMTPERGKQKGKREIPPASPSATAATSGEQGQPTPPQRERGRHGKPFEQPTVTPSAGGPNEISSEADQSPRQERGKGRRGSSGEEQGATPKVTPNAMEHNAATGLAPEEQTPGGKADRGRKEAAERSEPGAAPAEQGQQQRQNELAPKGESTNAETHQGRRNPPGERGQGQPGEEKKEDGQHKKKGAEPSPTPGAP